MIFFWVYSIKNNSNEENCEKSISIDMKKSKPFISFENTISFFFIDTGFYHYDQFEEKMTSIIIIDQHDFDFLITFIWNLNNTEILNLLLFSSSSINLSWNHSL